MNKSKKLIIVPGSCSSRTNWFDQLVYFEEQGYDVSFLDLEASRFRTLTEAAENLFLQLRKQLKSVDEALIISHSMGGMLILKILSESQFFSNDDAQSFEKLKNSKHIFLQVPLKVNPLMLLILNITKFLGYPFFLIYRVVFFYLFDFILSSLKRLNHLLKRVPVLNLLGRLFDFFLNQASILNSFFGTNAQEYYNLVDYYKQWDSFSLRSFMQKGSDNRFVQAMDGLGDDKSLTLNAENYYFSYGDPDFFCESQATKDFAEKISAQLLQLELGMHLPQHMLWTQKKLHKLIVAITQK